MPDDLSKLTPTDPSAVDPDWTEKRQGILDGVLTDMARRRRGIGGWVAGVAAAALVVVAIGGAVQQFRPEPFATPAEPTSTAGEPTDLVAARSVLLFTEDGAKLCRSGAVEYSRPPQCEGIPVENLSPEDVPSVERAGGVAWTPEVVVSGTFDGTMLTAKDVFDADDPQAPQPVPSRPADDDIEPFGDLCSDPIQGQGPSDRPLGEVEQELPGYQGTWGSDPHNVAVTGDVEAAKNTLAQYVQGDFCVGTVPGGSAADGYAAEKSVSTVKGVEYATYSVDSRGAWLLVMLLTDDDEAKAEIETLVGPEQWAYTAVLSFFYPVIHSDSPDPITTPLANEPIVAARDTLIDTGNGMTLCNGSVLESRPPGCPFPTPVTGITWDDVPWAETADGITFDETPGSITFADAVIVGTFDDDGDVFSATQVFRDDDPAAPQPPKYDPREAPSDVPGPSDEALQDAQQALKPLTRAVVIDPMTDDLVWNAWVSASQLGNRLEISVRRETPALLDMIEAAVGPEVWPHTDVIAFFYPAGASATPNSVEHSPGPFGTLPATAFTDEQRGWAEDSVASDLRSSAAGDRSDVTARMAKLTYGVYMKLWKIDIPEPPGPTPDDAEILVVALSASLDGSATRVAPPSLVTPDPTTTQAPQEPIGTVTVLDPLTGETLSQAFIVGGTPPAERLSQMAWFVEDVVLPIGYR